MFVALLISSGAPPAIQAADTVETFDSGAVDLELYSGLDTGVEQGGLQGGFGELVLGYGLLPRFSVHLGAALQGEDQFTSGSGAVTAGVFGTPLDTQHLDFDLLLDFAGEGTGLSDLCIAPGAEVNLDVKPDLELFGLYLRFAERICSMDVVVTEDDPMTTEDELTIEQGYSTESVLVAGAYLTFGRVHQLLVEYDTGFDHGADAAEDITEIGGVTFGYNVAVLDSLELIIQVYLDLPQGAETLRLGVMLGLISTLARAG